jgi:hypothetical protein
MTIVRGITILDLIHQLPDGAQGAIPGEIGRFLEYLSVVEFRSITTDEYFIHTGELQGATDAGLTLPADLPLHLPGLNAGVPFQLAWRREARVGDGPGDMEAGPERWTLDILVERISVPVPGPQPAHRVPTSPGQPQYLVPDESRDFVQVTGKGVVRIQGGPDGTEVSLVAPPDPMDPEGPNGMVLQLGVHPPHMLFHESGFGMTVGPVTWDQTRSYTPPAIEARGQDATWEGLAMSEVSVYLPHNLPIFGDVSFGARDLLYGFRSPSGLQFEAYLEVGNPLSSGEAIQFFQDLGEAIHHPADPGAGLVRTVVLHAETGERARVRAALDTGAEAIWSYRGHRDVRARNTEWFEVTPGNPDHDLRFRRIGVNEAGQEVFGPEVRYQFRRADAEPRHPPRITAQLDGESWENVVELSGTTAGLTGMVFSVVDEPALTPERREGLSWELEHDGTAITVPGDTFEPAPLRVGLHVLTLTDPDGRTRRLEIRVVDEGRLIVGCQDGPRQLHEGTEGPVGVTAVEGSYHLETFHSEEGERTPAGTQATLAGSEVLVPEGVLAEVVLELGTPEDPDEENPPTVRPVALARIFMVFEEDRILDPPFWRRIHPRHEGDGAAGDGFGPPDPYPDFGTTGGEQAAIGPSDAKTSYSRRGLLAWANSLPDETVFVVIGRCDDLGSESLNTRLGRNRAERGMQELTTPTGATEPEHQAIDEARVWYGGELEGILRQAATDATGEPTGIDALSARRAFNWRIQAHYDSWNDWPRVRDDRAARVEHRCAEIYAIIPDDAPVPADDEGRPSDEDSLDPARRRILVPGPDPTSPPEVAPRDVDLGYRAELRAKWDSPTVVDEKDWIPTLVELTVDWQRRSLALPDGMGNVQPEPVSPNANAEIWRLLGRFSHDARSGQAVFTVALDTPGDDKGILHLVTPDEDSKADEVVAVALGLGPALLAGIEAADPGSAAVRIGALIGAVGAVIATDLIKDGRVTLQKVEVQHRQPELGSLSGSVTRVVVDYTVELMAETELLGVKTDRPVRIRYKNAGIEYRDQPDREWYESLNLVYDDATFEIADPGKWVVNGALGQLLGVTAVRLGAGSFWLEVDMEFALDLGVIEITSASLRVSVDDGVSVALRGLGARVDVPGVLKGSGQLQLAHGGGVSAAVDLTIIPAELQAKAAFSMRDGMTHLEVGVRFATALPLGGTGFGIYGFLGRFVSNGTRNLEWDPGDPNAPSDDPVDRELAWYARPVLDKYAPRPGQYALGLGAVVGTMPDTGFSFNAVGMLAVEFPTPSVVFGIDASLMSKPDLSPSEEGGDGTGDISLNLLGIVAFDPTGLAIGIRGEFSIEKVLKVTIPIGAYFPFQNTGTAGYLRVGSDGHGGRGGSPVSITVLPDILDLKAFSYFMIEEKELLNLGGRGLDFHGFSIGFGAGWELKWGGDSIYVAVSASILMGLGTRPLTLVGGIYVSGELWLVIVGLSLRGELELRLMDVDGTTHWSLTGEFCGEVSFFFFSVKGCVSFEMGGPDPVLPPPPLDPLVTGVTLTDKFVRVIAEADEVGLGSAPGEEAVAWPDVAPTLHFSHRVQVDLPDGGFRPAPDGGYPGTDWAGSAKLKYLFKLTSLQLLDEGGIPLDTDGWPSVWWEPAFRASFPEEGDAPSSEHEGWDLALLHWDPRPWARNLPNGGEGLDADPARSVGNLCEPAPRESRHCVWGQDARRQSADRVEIRTSGRSALPYPSSFHIDAVEGLGPLSLDDVVELAGIMGLAFVPGGVGELPGPFSPPEGGTELTGAYRFPYLTQGGRITGSLGIRADFAPSVVEPELILAICLDLPDLERTAERCVDFRAFRPGTTLGRVLRHQGLTFTDMGAELHAVDLLPVGAPDGHSELRFSSKGVRIELPEDSDRVIVTGAYQQGGPLVATALDAGGEVVDRAVSPQHPNALLTLELVGEGIREVQLQGGFNTGVLQGVCYRFRQEFPREEYAHQVETYFREPQVLSRRVQRAAAPVVVGIGDDDRRDPTRSPWEWDLVDVAMGERHLCAYLRYTPPAEHEELSWRGFEVAPYPMLKVSVVSACAATAAARAAREADEAARESRQDHDNGAAEGEESDRHVILEPDRVYRIQVGYRAAIWQGSDDETRPPDVTSFDWNDPPDSVTVQDVDQQFAFRTAAEDAVPDEALMTFDAQQSWEPRALARYLLGFDPESDRFTHFLDDELLAHFEVEWVETLLERYGYDLRLQVKRTDPDPPAPGAGPITDLEVPSTVEWTPLPVWMRHVADIRVAQAADEAPCLEVPPSGASAVVRAELEPRAEYDLVITAVPQGAEPDQAAEVIGRTHFRTSRYRDAGQLLAAMGFGPAGRPGAMPVPEVVVSEPPPTDAMAEGDDVALDAALARMGLDPFPLPDRPRTVLLWTHDDGWKLAGVLLDSDESLFRAPRKEDVLDPGSPPGTEPPERLRVEHVEVGGHTFTVRRRNEAGTRVLLAPSEPADLWPGGGDEPGAADPRELRLELRDRGESLEGVRMITPIPDFVIKEPV